MLLFYFLLSNTLGELEDNTAKSLSQPIALLQLPLLGSPWSKETHLSITFTLYHA